MRDIPIIIPCHNNPTYVRGMLRQLSERKIHNVTLIDNRSTFPEMVELLREVSATAKIVRLRRNRGPHYFWKNWLFYHLRLPRIFCVTDPDLQFSPTMPDDFIRVLLDATERYSIGKAGLALDISDRALMKSDTITHGGESYKIWEWESQFWKNQISETPEGDPIFRAGIDTTFALYNKKYFDRRNFYTAVRIAGRFTAKHLPWYASTSPPPDEESYYRQTAGQHSWYFGARTSGA